MFVQRSSVFKISIIQSTKAEPGTSWGWGEIRDGGRRGGRGESLGWKRLRETARREGRQRKTGRAAEKARDKRKREIERKHVQWKPNAGVRAPRSLTRNKLRSLEHLERRTWRAVSTSTPKGFVRSAHLAPLAQRAGATHARCCIRLGRVTTPATVLYTVQQGCPTPWASAQILANDQFFGPLRIVIIALNLVLYPIQVLPRKYNCTDTEYYCTLQYTVTIILPYS